MLFRSQDNAFGRDGVKAFKDALKKAKLAHEEYLPGTTTDFTAGAQRLFDSLKDKPGRKIIFIIWAGAGNPFKIADLDPKRYGIEIASGGNILPAMTAYKNLPGMEGATYYYFGIPKNKVNEWLVSTHRIGVTAGASAPEGLVKLVIERLKELGVTDVKEMQGAPEGVEFKLPEELAG